MKKRTCLGFFAVVVLLSFVALGSSAAWEEKETASSVLAPSDNCSDTIPEVFVGDFNDDDKDDLGVYRPDENAFYVLISDGKRFGASRSGQWITPGTFGNPNGQFYIGDFNGDDKDDLGFFEPSNNTFWVTLSTGRDFGKDGSGRWIDSGEFGHKDGQYFVGYFNGGKKADLGFFDPTNNTFHVSLSTGSEFGANHSGRWVGPNEFGHFRGRYMVGDYNDDGSEDLAFFEPGTPANPINSTQVSCSDGEGFFGPHSGQWIPGGWFGNMGGQHFVGDFDGDGEDDLGFFEPGNEAHPETINTFHVSISTGRHFYGDRSGKWVDSGELGHAGGQYLIGDFNGGGKSDLAFFDHTNFSVYVGLSTANGFDFKGSGYWANLRQCRAFVPLFHKN